MTAKSGLFTLRTSLGILANAAGSARPSLSTVRSWPVHSALRVNRFQRPMSMFASSRPLAHLFQRSMAQTSARRWASGTSLIRPWHRVAVHNPWRGHVPRMDYRVKRARLDQKEMPAVARRSVAELEYIEPSAPYEPAEISDGNPSWTTPEGLNEPTIEMQSAEEYDRQFEPEIPSPSMTVSLPQEWLAEAASTGTASPELLPAVNTPLHARLPMRSQPRHVAQAGAPMIARMQRTRSLSTVVGGAVPFAVTHPSRASASSPISLEHAQSSEMGASASVHAPSQMTKAGIPPIPSKAIGESFASSAAPVWPLSFVTPHIARLAASTPDYDDSEEEAPLPSATEIAPMVVRRSALQTPLAHAVPGLPALSSLVRPAGRMLAHVPSTELDLGNEMRPLVQRREVVRPEMPSSTNAAVTAEVRLISVRRRDEVRQTDAASEYFSSEPERMVPALTPTAQMPMPGPSSSAITVREWPVLPYVQRSAPQEPEGAEPPAIQVLRRRGPTAHSSAISILSTLPSLGRGAPLPEAVRRPMETLLGRDLSAVETHESAVAESLGAEAFTSGQRIVFAPGRLDYRSARGLAVVGHELTHVGQPLAFREWSVSSAMDAAENTARQQETQIEQSLTQNWPNAPHMEVLQATQALRSLVSRGGAAAAAAGPGGPEESTGDHAAADGQSAGGAASGGQAAGGAAATGSVGALAGGGEPVATARLSAAPSGPAGGGAKAGSQNIDQLALEVYDLLKVRLRGELMRHTLYS